MSANRHKPFLRKMTLVLAALALSVGTTRAADTIDVVVDAFATGGQLLGVSLGPTERAVVKDLLRCTAVEGKELPECARRAVTSPLLGQIPADLRPVAECLIGGTNPRTCATEQVLDRLPPEAHGIAQCIGGGDDIGACARQFATDGALKQAFDVINGLEVDRAASNPMLQADKTIRNLICTIQGVNDEEWLEVVHCGGSEVAKKVVRTILSTLISPAVVTVLGPAIDGMIEDRADFIAEIVKAAKAGDERRLTERAAEAYILTGTPLAALTAVCHLIPDGAVKELTCGTVGKAVRWTTRAVGDVGEGIVDAAEDVALALGGNQCKAAPHFYRDTIAGCLAYGVSQLNAASLDPGSTVKAQLFPDLENEIYAQCRRDVQGWYKRGVFGSTSTTECANSVCDPLRAQFRDQSNVIADAMLDVAFGFGSAAHYEGERVKIGTDIYQCQRWGAEARFVTDCINALKGQFSYLEGGSCTIHGTSVASTPNFFGICQSVLERAGKRSISNCACPEDKPHRTPYGSASDDKYSCSSVVSDRLLPTIEKQKDKVVRPAPPPAVEQNPALKKVGKPAPQKVETRAPRPPAKPSRQSTSAQPLPPFGGPVAIPLGPMIDVFRDTVREPDRYDGRRYPRRPRDTPAPPPVTNKPPVANKSPAVPKMPIPKMPQGPDPGIDYGGAPSRPKGPIVR